MKFSVVVPVYNNASLISRCISSVLTQSFEDFELIIVDDGSTDDLNSEVMKYMDKRIIYVKKDNGGVSSARNTGILSSNGDYVCFLDSDDEYCENHLLVLNDLINKYPEAGIYATSHITLLMDGSKKYSSEYLSPILNNREDAETDDGFQYILRAKSDIIHTNSMCIKRSCFDSMGMFTLGESNGEDLDVWYRMIGNYKFVITVIPTTIRHREDSGLSRTIRFVKNPAYLNALKSIINDNKANENIRRHAKFMLYRYKISEANNEILCGNRYRALCILISIRPNVYNYKKLVRAYICLPIPRNILLRVYGNRRNNFYA